MSTTETAARSLETAIKATVADAGQGYSARAAILGSVAGSLPGLLTEIGNLREAPSASKCLALAEAALGVATAEFRHALVEGSAKAGLPLNPASVPDDAVWHAMARSGLGADRVIDVVLRAVPAKRR